MKRPNMRPVMEEYTTSNSTPNNPKDLHKHNPTSSQSEKSCNKNESHYDRNVLF